MADYKEALEWRLDIYTGGSDDGDKTGDDWTIFHNDRPTIYEGNCRNLTQREARKLCSLLNKGCKPWPPTQEIEE